MKSEKLKKTVRSKMGKLVSLEPFSFKKEREFYQLYQTSQLDWEKFLVLHFKNIDDAHAFIAQEYNNDKFTGYFVVNNETKKLVGFVLGDEVTKDSVMAEIAIGCNYQRLGYGTEAVNLFEYIMTKARYRSVTMACDEKNERMNNLALRSNYAYKRSEDVDLGSMSMKFKFHIKMLERSK